MYNRYIPQSDGSYRRSQMQDPAAGHQSGNSPQPQQQNPPPQRPAPSHPEPYMNAPPDQSGNPLGNLLSGLLPQSFDTEDMIIILLLLLLGNSKGEPSGAFLTLIIYLFL